jgi:hypothetical protein
MRGNVLFSKTLPLKFVLLSLVVVIDPERAESHSRYIVGDLSQISRCLDDVWNLFFMGPRYMESVVGWRSGLGVLRRGAIEVITTSTGEIGREDVTADQLNDLGYQPELRRVSLLSRRLCGARFESFSLCSRVASHRFCSVRRVILKMLNILIPYNCSAIL